MRGLITTGSRLTNALFFGYFALLLVLRGQGVFFYSLCLAGIVTFLINRHGRPPLPHAARYWLTALGAYFCAMVLIKLADHEAARQYDLLSRYLLAILLVLALVRFPLSVKTYAAALAAAGIGALVTVSYQRFALGMREDFAGQHHILFSNIAMITGIAGLFAARLLPKKGQGAAVLAGSICAMLAAVLGGGRGSWLMLPPVLVWFICCLPKEKRGKGALAIAGVFVLAAVTAYLIPATGVAGKIHRLVLDFHQYAGGNAVSSQGQRLEMWRCGLTEMLPQKPWLGWGSEGLYAELQHLSSTGQCLKTIGDFHHLHNDFIDRLVRYGAAGFAVFTLFMLAAPAYYARALIRFPLNAQQRLLAQSGIAVSLAFFIGSLTNANFTHSINVFTYLMLHSAIMALLTEKAVPAGGRV